MLNQRRHQAQRRHSSVLDLEAANYFKLDLAQVHSLGQPEGVQAKNQREFHKAHCESSCRQNRHQQQQRQQHQEPSFHRDAPIKAGRKSTIERPHGSELQQHRCEEEWRGSLIIGANEEQRFKRRPEASMEARRKKAAAHKQRSSGTLFSSSRIMASSSSGSTSSLPSISSSPSVSPSLVCPHLSLDDILARDQRDGSASSPHTIGLCSRCRLNPPPNIHSPLSPTFAPSKCASSPKKNLDNTCNQVPSRATNKQHQHQEKYQMRRFNSDYQPASQVKAARNRQTRDDSLDYYLAPEEAQRLELSPTLRHSVEYLRNNSIEAGRVLRVHKNGLPFDKPLRICITRGEFANVNQLLDHINSRQLIPLGARYLFHLDGQLVYSVNELKHGSIYIVSGTRTFDFRANSLLKEASDRQLEQSRARREPAALKERSHSSLVEAKICQQNAAPVEERVAKTSAIKVTTFANNSNRQTCAGAGKRAPTKQVARKQSPAIQMACEEPAEKRSMSKSVDCLESAGGSKEALLTRGSTGGACLMRAKSELDGAASKRKKNVTFVDTGRGSSPAIAVVVSPTERNAREQKEDSSIRGLNKNEIGIQVSDSIEGFLIDLPLALPPSKREAEDGGESSPTKKRDFLRKGQGQKRALQSQLKLGSGLQGQVQNKAEKSRAAQEARKAATEKAAKGAKKQIVTLSERQLSLDEMSQLKDLDHGDHHSESELSRNAGRIIIKLDHVDEVAPEEAELRGQVELEEAEQQQQAEKEEPGGKAANGRWEYPGGRESSATPTERPVSQNEASEQVHARVTTPSPSMSAGGGDNASLSLDTNSLGSLKPGAESPSACGLARPVVCGRLCRGSSAPEENFTLSWVNGFSINDLYPENSATPLAQPAAGGAARLSPQRPASANQPSEPPASRFKPAERFHNWLCHSRKHDELVYPAGSLVVLWSRWSNQQRYYARHTSNVSALTLAALHADLAASAQLAEPSDKSTCSQVHLWSLSSLELLQVIDDDHFRGRRIFSLKLGSPSPFDGACELSAAARDEKRLWLYDVSVKLAAFVASSKKPDFEPTTTTTAAPLKQTKPAKAAGASSSISVIKLNKPLQANQTPLGLTRLRQPSSGGSKQQQVEVLASVGRRHFQLSFVDWRQLRLKPMKAVEKSAELVEIIAKASCFVRLAANELVIGDSDGNIALLRLDFRSAALSRSPIKGTLSGSSGEQQPAPTYKMETLCLLNATPLGQQSACAITCLARVSGNLFASADSSSALRLWRLEARADEGAEEAKISCRQVSSVSLPADLGFVCALSVARYSRKPGALVEFYLASSSNALLFGQLEFGASTTSAEQKEPRWSLSVLYEGHEAAALGLVADVPVARPATRARALITSAAPAEHGHYFTCSPDQTICKWSGRQLSWKSRLPSACASLAVHPTGFVLAAGSADGTVYILDKVSGLLVSYLALTPVCINCLAYSREGLLLAAGCANGSIFILPVQERGLKYQKVSIFQSPYPVVSLQFSLDSRFLLTSVTHALYQELILWDLPNFRYMRDNVKLVADKIAWHDAICSGSEDVRAIWENANISLAQATGDASLRQPLAKRGSFSDSTSAVVNLSCHRLTANRQDKGKQKLAIASDMRGYLRLFRYPCYDIQQGFYEIRVTSSPVNCCRFLAPINRAAEENAKFVSLSSDGSICLWTLGPTTEQ